MGWKGAGRDAAGGGCGRDVGGFMMGFQGGAGRGGEGRGGVGWREGYEGEEDGVGQRNRELGGIAWGFIVFI